MVRDTICLFDSDTLYGRIILQALLEEEDMSVTYAYFDQLDTLCAFLKSSNVVLLLVEQNRETAFYDFLRQQGLSKEEILKFHDKVLLLSEDNENTEQTIYKYLPRQAFKEQIRRHRLSKLRKSSGKEPSPTFIGENRQIAGYITFGGLGLRTYLASRQQSGKACLILNLELFAYTTPHDKPKKNMSDLIYLATLNQLARADMKDYIYTEGVLDYVEPIVHYSDGYELQDSAAEYLIDYLRTLAYDHIILVTDCRHRGATRLLELCDQVVVEEAENPVQQQKRNIMIQMFHLEQREGLLNKLEQEKRDSCG